MTSAKSFHDIHRSKETLQRLRRTAQELEGVGQQQEQVSVLLSEVLYLTRAILDEHGTGEGTRMIARALPRLGKIVARIQASARQLAITADDLQALMTNQFAPKSWLRKS